MLHPCPGNKTWYFLFWANKVCIIWENLIWGSTSKTKLLIVQFLKTCTVSAADSESFRKNCSYFSCYAFQSSQTRVYRNSKGYQWGAGVGVLQMLWCQRESQISLDWQGPVANFNHHWITDSQTMVYRNSKGGWGLAYFTMLWCHQSITDDSRHGMLLGTQWYSSTNRWCKPWKMRTIHQQVMEAFQGGVEVANKKFTLIKT